MLWPLWWLIYHLFCCCLCKSQQPSEFDNRIISKLKKNLKHLSRKKINDEVKTMYSMVQLLKKSPKAVDHLQSIRINPKLSRSSKKDASKPRYDLEFYLPQILSHYLRHDLSTTEESLIKEFMIKACQTNIFFAHKTWFNLKASLINKENNTQVVKILQLLSELEVIITQGPEKLYLASSDQLIKLVMKTNMQNLLDPDCLRICLAEMQDKSKKEQGSYFMTMFTRSKPLKSKKDDINLGSLETLLDEESSPLVTENSAENNILGDKFQIKFSPYMRAIKPGFDKSRYMQKADEFKTKAFFSTPNFINDLTEISVAILLSQDKMQFLQSSL